MTSNPLSAEPDDVVRHAPASPPSAERWLTAHGDYLYRLALLELRNEAQAEDAVQETLLAALRGYAGFDGRASERTWLTGILKHKIVDIIRRDKREARLDPTPANSGESPDIDELLFNAKGDWISPPADWGDPDQALEQKRFWEAFATCLKKLPAEMALMFSMREISGMDTAEICKVLEISATNGWVRLHRARLSLKECLEWRWLGKTEK